MNGYLIGVTCPLCGACCESVTEGRVIAGTEARAVLRCTICRPVREFVVEVFLRPVRANRDESACGTPAGYARHRRAGESACEKCLRAQSISGYERAMVHA